MKFIYKYSVFSFLFFLICCSITAQAGEKITIVIPQNAHARIVFAAGKLTQELKTAGYDPVTVKQNAFVSQSGAIIIGALSDELVRKAMSAQKGIMLPPGKEGFSLRTINKNIVIAGADYSGALYGALELCDQVHKAGKIPASLDITEKPEMVMRGTCIGMQKPYYLPERTVYEYPYTPETFPWFYDKQLWIRYLDSMAENRYNALYLWSGHPFASLVRLKEYPYAVEVDDATFKKNEEIFKFLTEEADKRGIWVIQMFYNILVSKPFAEKNNMVTQDRNRPIVPVIADYTRKSIAAFVEKYPNVGLMVALGEAMEGVGQDDIDWFTKTIIPGVKDGLKALGKTEEPPIVLRAHDTDAPAVLAEALKIYKNLYTEAKFNGEALTTYEPRGSWAELHRTLSHIGTVQIENVHILANLEPFRYASPDFIQKSVLAMHKVYEANGLHLYPQASFWDWPYAADSLRGTNQRLLELQRDWLWYKAWARYAWKSNRDRNEEIKYWSDVYRGEYKCSEDDGRNILTAYEESGEIAPKLLRRFGITDGNRQTLTLGMLMAQLINPERFGLFTLLYESEAPPGEPLAEYAEKEARHQPHSGETPVKVINEVRAHGDKAVKAIDAAAAGIKTDKEEFARVQNDMHIYKAMGDCYAAKAQAALYVLSYKYTADIADLEKAYTSLNESVESFSILTTLTNATYKYANSMQTKQRKIPMRGVDGTYKTWKEMLPVYEDELHNFRHNIDSLKSHPVATVKGVTALKNAAVTLTGKPGESYTVDTTGTTRVFSDSAFAIKASAKELIGLKGVKLSQQAQITSGTSISFKSKDSVKVLVGFFVKKDKKFGESSNKGLYLKEPELETDASANDYGQAEIKIANAMVIENMPAVNVHSYSFGPGAHTLVLGKGACMVLGFISDKQELRVYDAGLNSKGAAAKDLDWLFGSY